MLRRSIDDEPSPRSMTNHLRDQCQYHMPHATCHMLHTTCSDARCHMPHATCHMLTCHMLTCHMLTCFYATRSDASTPHAQMLLRHTLRCFCAICSDDSTPHAHFTPHVTWHMAHGTCSAASMHAAMSLLRRLRRLCRFELFISGWCYRCVSLCVVVINANVNAIGSSSVFAAAAQLMVAVMLPLIAATVCLLLPLISQLLLMLLLLRCFERRRRCFDVVMDLWTMTSTIIAIAIHRSTAFVVARNISSPRCCCRD